LPPVPVMVPVLTMALPGVKVTLAPTAMPVLLVIAPALLRLPEKVETPESKMPALPAVIVPAL
jgi:hypothetical protein